MINSFIIHDISNVQCQLFNDHIHIALYWVLFTLPHMSPDLCWSNEYPISCTFVKYANPMSVSPSLCLYVCLHILKVKVMLESPFFIR